MLPSTKIYKALLALRYIYQDLVQLDILRGASTSRLYIDTH